MEEKTGDLVSLLINQKKNHQCSSKCECDKFLGHTLSCFRVSLLMLSLWGQGLDLRGMNATEGCGAIWNTDGAFVEFTPPSRLLRGRATTRVMLGEDEDRLILSASIRRRQCLTC